MKLVKQTLIAAAISASLFGGVVHAGAIGTAYLEISDLIVTKNSDNSTLTVGLDVFPTGSGIINTADTTATLNGVTQDETLQAPPVAVNDVSGAGFACVGACAYVNNTFSYLTKPQDVAASYVVADILLTGAIVDGIPGIPSPANAQALVESAVAPNDVGSADSNIGVNSQFDFVSQIDDALTFRGNFDAYLRAALVDVEGLTANASLSWSLSLVDLTDNDVFSYQLGSSDGLLINDWSALSPGQDDEFSFTGPFQASTPDGFMEAGHNYQLTIRHTVGADSAAFVAVPAPLALMGAGLLVLGGIQRRRSRSAAA